MHEALGLIPTPKMKRQKKKDKKSDAISPVFRVDGFS
jgi:hypothetical protein